MGFCSFILVGALCMQFASQVNAMDCEIVLGVKLSCPTLVNDSDEVFCCHTDGNIPYCCDVGNYVKQNYAILAGILIGGVIVLIIITLCCCCFCSCCCLAKRRTQHGRVLYAPVSPPQIVQPTSPPVSAYPLQSAIMVHSPPASSPNPPQYPPPYPHDNFQPPVNPDFKY